MRKNSNNWRTFSFLLTVALSAAASPQLRAASIEQNFSVDPPTAGFPMDLQLLGSTTTTSRPSTVTVTWGGNANSDVYAKCSQSNGQYVCDYYAYQLEYKISGTYNIKVTVTTTLGGVIRFSKNITVYPYQPSDFVIVSIGDSVASGEGNPVIKGPTVDLTTGKQAGGLWDYGESGCHGSSWAGPAQAAEDIRAAESSARSKEGLPDPPNIVTFFHIACSGAPLSSTGIQLQKVTHSLEDVGEYDQAGDDDATADSGGGLDEVGDEVTGKDVDEAIDALLITGGADDIDGGFSRIVETCFGPMPGNKVYTTTQDFKLYSQEPVSPLYSLTDPGLSCARPLYPDHKPKKSINMPTWTLQKSLSTELSGSNPQVLNGFQSIYHDLANGWTTKTGQKIPAPPLSLPESTSLDAQHSVVYVTSYYDGTKDAAGDFPVLAENIPCSHDLLNNKEWQYLYYHMLVPLNQDIKGAARNYRWHYISQPMLDFKKHGLCAWVDKGGHTWLVRPIINLVTRQFDISGSAHPNHIGQSDYAQYLANAIESWTLPVTTASATSAGGKTYNFDNKTWSRGDVTVTLSASNKLHVAGVGETLYSINDASCGQDLGTTTETSTCLKYGDTPFSVRNSGENEIYFLSSNKTGHFESVKTEQIYIDKLTSNSGQIRATAGQIASGHLSATADPLVSYNLAFKIEARPAHGTVKLTDPQTGGFTYTPDSGYVGNDSFKFAAEDSHVTSNIATEKVIVAAAGSPGSTSSPGTSGSGSSGGSVATSASSGGGGALGPFEVGLLSLLTALSFVDRRRTHRLKR